MAQPPLTPAVDPATSAAPDAEWNRRRAGRISPYWVRCDVGHVLDVSATGLKLLSTRRRKGMITCSLTDGKRGVTLQAEVVWSTRIRWRQHEVGLRFFNVSPEEAKQLAIIASSYHEAH
jgi:hypothetical protein